MHNSQPLLRHLSQRLDEVLCGYSLVSCFSQNKDEMIIEFNNGEKSFFIKAYLHSDFCCLSFPLTFKRARKNSIDLFNPLLLKEVVKIKSFDDERAFAIEFPENQTFFFKMFGNQSNVILFRDDEVAEIFRNNFKNDFTLKLKSFITAQFGKSLKNEYFIIERNGRIQFSLESKEKVISEFKDPINALNEFFNLKISTDAVFQEKTKALKLVNDKFKRTNQYLSKLKSELESLRHDDNFQLWADLLMANLSHIKKGVENISLKDFMSDKVHPIRMKKDLTAQQNAAMYYRKAKNKILEIKKLSDTINEKEELLKKILKVKASIEKENDSTAIFKIILESGMQTKAKTQTERLPYRQIEFMDYSILIGKNANDNDVLTLKHTYKEDLWFHAKDVSGSHVVVKYKSGKNFPKLVIERAAQLAAFYSKRKGETLCPVAYTAKKFVRKRKGDPPGLVVVEKAKVILVEPKS